MDILQQDPIFKVLGLFPNLKKYVFPCKPVPKPRMTRADKWKKRTATDRYWKFKDDVVKFAKIQNLKTLPGFLPGIIFYVPIPKTKLKKVNEGDVVEVRPDIDNYIKALLDSLEVEDNYIHTFGTVGKRYSHTPRIELYLEE